MSAGYQKLRFDWKRAVFASPEIGRSAKQLAVVLCDTYVNKETGMCWPKNATLANSLALSIRAIQRGLRALEVSGYLEQVKVPGRRRVYRICFPLQHHDSEPDNLSGSNVTSVDAGPDTTVTPYKNQGNNQGKRSSFSGSHLTVIWVGEDETGCMSDWKLWMAAEFGDETKALFKLLRKRSKVALPCRYPREEDRLIYVRFFEMVRASDGRCLDGP